VSNGSKLAESWMDACFDSLKFGGNGAVHACAPCHHSHDKPCVSQNIAIYKRTDTASQGTAPWLAMSVCFQIAIFLFCVPGWQQ